MEVESFDYCNILSASQMVTLLSIRAIHRRHSSRLLRVPFQPSGEGFVPTTGLVRRD